MAAPYSPTELRIRLRFDYPPPAIPESSDFWFLLDSENCRAVTDVSAIIRKRFYYGRQGALSLYLDGRLLHPRENMRIIRDNDTISVKWEESPRGQLTTDSQGPIIVWIIGPSFIFWAEKRARESILKIYHLIQLKFRSSGTVFGA
ncbi:coilin-like [Ranitomeya variabilis]|uniref:coilin-like n=1 Tax=Ranitomeya variabilis TaxID=490064 RepID=UPI004055E697